MTSVIKAEICLYQGAGHLKWTSLDVQVTEKTRIFGHKYGKTVVLQNIVRFLYPAVIGKKATSSVNVVDTKRVTSASDRPATECIDGIYASINITRKWHDSCPVGASVNYVCSFDRQCRSLHV